MTERNDANFTIRPDDVALFTDLYELSMLQSYHDAGMTGDAVFSLFVRRLPKGRNYLMACGLAEVLECLERLRFSDEAIAYLRGLGRFSDGFLDSLNDFRFTGEVRAMAEGTPFFANEPILEVAAPIGQAQLVETLVMNQIQLQTLLASKASRVVTAAAGRAVVDFGARRMHGFDAALRAARAFHIAGVAATSNVLAGARYGVPVTGTMAHSYVQAFDSEYEAFRTFARTYPETVLLVDTYDTIEGVRNVIRLARELGADFRVKAVRLDSGDLAALAFSARRLLNEAGLDHVDVIASGGLDEYAIAELVAEGAPITAFGVGTAMGVSSDAPALDIAYKLSAYDGRGRLKLSPGKETYPGRKQVFRAETEEGAVGDTIAREGEELPGRPLLRTVMRGGRRLTAPAPTLDDTRADAARELRKLPEAVRAIAPPPTPYPVRVSDALIGYRDEVVAALNRR